MFVLLVSGHSGVNLESGFLGIRALIRSMVYVALVQTHYNI